MSILWVKFSQITPLFRLKQRVCRWVTKPLLTSAFSSGNASAWTTRPFLRLQPDFVHQLWHLFLFIWSRSTEYLSSQSETRDGLCKLFLLLDLVHKNLWQWRGGDMGRILTHRVAGLQSWAHGSEKLGGEPHLVQGSLGFLQYAFSH